MNADKFIAELEKECGGLDTPDAQMSLMTAAVLSSLTDKQVDKNLRKDIVLKFFTVLRLDGAYRLLSALDDLMDQGVSLEEAVAAAVQRTQKNLSTEWGQLFNLIEEASLGNIGGVPERQDSGLQGAEGYSSPDEST